MECLLSLAAKKYPDEPFILSLRQMISYRHFDNAVCLAVDWLRQLGFKKGDRLAICAPNSPEYIGLLVALWRMGIVACLMSTRLPPLAAAEQLKELNCKKLITSPEILPMPASWAGDKYNLKSIVNFNRADRVRPKEFKIDPVQEATIIFTSGTSGRPKAAVHTYANYYYSALGSNENIAVQKGDRWLLSLPLYHVGGLGIVFRTLLGIGAIVFPEAHEDIAAVVKHFKITHLSLVPTQLYRLFLKRYTPVILSRVKHILLGGGPASENLIQKALTANLPIYLTYGLTEMASQVATSTKGNPSSCKILSHRELKISDESEILVRGETLFKGYVQADKLFLPRASDGWFKTGDLGRLDNQGNLVVFGRKDNMFVSGGENIQPEEIESLLQKFQAVENAFIVGVPNPEYGRRPVAFIKPVHGKKIEKDALFAYLSARLPKFKIPNRFFRWPNELKEVNVKMNRRDFSELVEKQQRKFRPLW